MRAAREEETERALRASCQSQRWELPQSQSWEGRERKKLRRERVREMRERERERVKPGESEGSPGGRDREGEQGEWRSMGGGRKSQKKGSVCRQLYIREEGGRGEGWAREREAREVEHLMICEQDVSAVAQ